MFPLLSKDKRRRNTLRQAGRASRAAVVVGVLVAGIGVTYSRTWVQNIFHRDFVPSGVTRRLTLYQASRAFNVTKQSFNRSLCRYVTVYANQPVNAPLKALPNGLPISMIWKLTPA
jgi:hypothetical protein